MMSSDAKDTMGRKKKNKNEFDQYTYHYPKNGDTTPYVTLWVNTCDTEYRGGDKGNDRYRYKGTNTEILKDYGCSLGAYLGRAYIGRSKALTEEHIGFMPQQNDVVWMVIESHTEGDSFGHTDEAFRPVKVFKTYQDANAWLGTEEAERCKMDGYFERHNEYIIKDVHVS